MNEFLPQTPFDLYELHLVQMVAAMGSFTKAATAAGLTQSAVTRQIGGVEDRLGTRLFERTTRRVVLTEAGKYLIGESRRLTGDIDALIKRLRQDFGGAPKEVRIGFSRSIGLSYYPGFLIANRRSHPELVTRIWQAESILLLQRLEEGALDIAIVSRPPRLPSALRAIHRFRDEFVLIAPADPAPLPKGGEAVRRWAEKQTWIMLHEEASTGMQLRRWMKRNRFPTEAAMEADNFDLVINLVALGYGTSFVPHRALSLYPQRRQIRRILLKERFSRELIVLVRAKPEIPPHIAHFVGQILF
ncbi:MAG TPA: LysR family transcriptional regulator [Candidatus Methylacidiphilales bacterium]